MNRLISFLGTGQYEPTTYTLDGHSARSQFVVAALHQLLVEIKEVHVIGTKESFARNGEALDAAFAEIKLDPPFRHEISSGLKADDLWLQFGVLSELLQCDRDDNIALDITHGFRAQPFFASAVVNFVQSIHPNHPNIEILYGEYRKDAETSPIWGLTSFVELLEWSRDLHLFLRTGRAEGIAYRPTEEGKSLILNWSKSGRLGKQPGLEELGKALKQFSGDFATIRIGYLLTKPECDPSRKNSSAQRLYDAVEPARKEVEKHFPPLAAVLNDVREMVRPLVTLDRLSGPAGQKAMCALAELYLILDRYTEAAVVLREGLPTRFSDHKTDMPGSLNFDNEARKKLGELFYEKDRWWAEKIGKVRNDIQHGGFMPHPLQPIAIRDQLENLIGEWRKLVSK